MLNERKCFGLVTEQPKNLITIGCLSRHVDVIYGKS